MARSQTELLYGFHPVHEAIRAGRRPIHGVYLQRRRQDDRGALVKRLAAGQGLPIETLAERQLTDLAGHAEHQGVCAKVGLLPCCEVPDILGPAVSQNRPPFVVLLDNLQDPQNLGAVIRTAYCAGVDGIIIPRDRAAGPRPSVSKASAGAMEHMPVARVTNLVNTIRELKKAGLWIVGLAGEADHPLFDCDLTIPLGLIIGGEAKGLRPLVKRHCDFLVAIPHARAFNSLNASVAAALAVFETFRQRLTRNRAKSK